MAIEQLHLLVAEDHDFQRKALVRMLNGLGAQHVSEAPNGQAALEIFRNRLKPIDIIISDLEMPGMDGMEFMRHVGEANLPVSVNASSDSASPTSTSSARTNRRNGSGSGTSWRGRTPACSGPVAWCSRARPRA